MNGPSAVLKCRAEPSSPRRSHGCQARIVQAPVLATGPSPRTREKMHPFVPEASLESAKGTSTEDGNAAIFVDPERITDQKVSWTAPFGGCQPGRSTIPAPEAGTTPTPPQPVLAGWWVSKRDTQP